MVVTELSTDPAVPEAGRTTAKAQVTAEPHVDKAASAASASIFVSAVRCLFTYVFIPALAPVLGIRSSISTPIMVALYILGITLAIRGIRLGVRTDRRGPAMLSGLVLVANVVGLVLHLI